MQDLNSVFMIGRMVRDAELKYTNTGYAILNFSIASNRSVKKDEQWQDVVSFFNCTIFGKRAESIAQYMTKGKQLAIDGALSQDRWTDKDGNKRNVVKILVDKVQFIGGKPQQATAAAPVATAEPDPDVVPIADNFDDNIPF